MWTNEQCALTCSWPFQRTAWDGHSESVLVNIRDDRVYEAPCCQKTTEFYVKCPPIGSPLLLSKKLFYDEFMVNSCWAVTSVPSLKGWCQGHGGQSVPNTTFARRIKPKWNQSWKKCGSCGFLPHWTQDWASSSSRPFCALTFCSHLVWDTWKRKQEVLHE